MARPKKKTPWSEDMTKAPHDRHIAVWGKTNASSDASEFVAKWDDTYQTFFSKTGWVIISVTRWAEIK